MKRTFVFLLSAIICMALIVFPSNNASAATPTTKQGYKDWYMSGIVQEQKFGSSNLSEAQHKSTLLLAVIPIVLSSKITGAIMMNFISGINSLRLFKARTI